MIVVVIIVAMSVAVIVSSSVTVMTSMMSWLMRFVTMVRTTCTSDTSVSDILNSTVIDDVIIR